MKFLRIEWNNKVYNLWAEREGKKLWIHYQGSTWQWKPPEKTRRASVPSSRRAREVLSAPMPGRILKLPVKKGAKVKKGDVLLVLSAMKMEYNFQAEGEGVITEILCQSGDQVEADQVLMKVKYTDQV